MPSDIRLNRQLFDHQQQVVDEARAQAIQPFRRQIRFEIVPDNHAPLTDADREAIQRVSDEAANRAEYQFYQQYQNSWGSWDDVLTPEPRRETQEEQAVPSSRTRSFAEAYGGTVTGRMSSSGPNPQSIPVSARPSARLANFDRQRALRTMIEQGYDDWAFVLEVPGPFPEPTTLGVLECVRTRPNGTLPERRYFVFNNRYQLANMQTESEYVTALRRRCGDVAHFYQAQADGRRRMVAKVLAAGAEQYQLLLAPVVDDDTLREGLTSREYRRFMATPEQRAKAAVERMRVFKRQRRDATHVEPLPLPETERGRRAANAAERNNRGSRVAERRSRRAPLQAVPVDEGQIQEFTINPTVRF